MDPLISPPQPADRYRWVVALALPGVLIALFVVLPAARFAAHRPLPASQGAEAAYLGMRLQMAQAGGIGLVLDLSAGVAELQVAGVPVRQSPIARYDVGAGVRGDTVFALRMADATIVKEPVRVVRAPQDTAEANARPPLELPVEDAAVHFTLDFSPDLVLHVREAQGGHVRRALFGAGQRLVEAGRAVNALFQARLPDHTPEVTIELSREDARAVYRALPDDARLVLRLPASGTVAVQVPDTP